MPERPTDVSCENPYDMLPVGIIVIDEDYVIRSWNDCIAGWTGHPCREVAGENLLSLFPHLGTPIYRTRIEQVFSGGPAVIFSPRFHPHLIPAPLQGGGQRVQSTTVVPVASGDRFFAMIVIEDVTDLSRQVTAYREMRNVAERELDERRKAEENAQRLAAIVESSDDAIIGKTLDGIITSWNLGAERLYGYTAEEMIGKPLSVLEPEQKAEDITDILDRVRNGESISHYQTVRKKRDGTIVDISLTVSPIRDKDGRITGASSIARDITRAKLMEEVVRQANKKLNLLNSITRHDIINQLTGMRAYIELLKDCVQNKDCVTYVLNQEKAAENIGRQLEFMRSYQDIGVKSPVWQNLPETIRIAVAQLDLRSVSFAIDIPSSEIFADPLLQRVFYNLVENALRHGETISAIRFHLEEATGSLIVVCEDNGVGVPLEVKEQIFKREYFKHTGFGLYLSREILSITGIAIRETGVPGRGARFELVIPKASFRTIG